MIAVEALINELSGRLPELAWKLEALYFNFNPKTLPRGLFQPQFEMTPQSCIDEIKEDLRRLNAHKDERTLYYIANRVTQKINVLVRLCQVEKDRKPIKQESSFGVQALNTRQQWLITLQEDIDKLDVQQKALFSALKRREKNQDFQAMLSLQADLGDIERRLTLAQETLNRATGDKV